MNYPKDYLYFSNLYDYEKLPSLDNKKVLFVFGDSWTNNLYIDESTKHWCYLLKEKLENEPGRFGDRCCDLTIIGDEDQVTHFTEKIQSCFLTKKEIIEWRNGHKFKDPWPKNIVKINDNLS